MSRLSTDQVSDYRKRGFLRVPGLLSTEAVEGLKSELDELLAREDSEAGRRAARSESFPRQSSSGRPVRNLVDPIVPHSRCVRRILQSEDILEPLVSLLGDEPRLFKDKLILRPPGTEGYGLHQDYAYYGWTGVPADQMLALQIAIDDADADNGALQLYPGEHQRPLRPTEHDGNDLREDLIASEAELVPTRAGDGLFFHSLTPHRSGKNRSRRFRRTLYLTYNAASAGDLYRIYYQDRADVVEPWNEETA